MLKKNFSSLVSAHDRAIKKLLVRSGFQSSEALRRGALLVKILAYGGFFCGVMAAVRYQNDNTASVFISALGAGLLLLYLVALALTGRMDFIADLAIVSVFALILAMALADGGLLSRVMMWLPALPLMANFVGVRCRAFSACVLGVGGLVGLFVGHSLGYIENRLPDEPLFGRMMAGIVSILFISGMAQAYEKARGEAERHIFAAVKEAKQLAQLKSDFLANMSHEIRSPLNGLIGMLRLLVRGDLEGKQAERAQLAYSGAQSLLSLLNDILDLSKIDAGKMKLEQVEFDLSCVLGELVEALAFEPQEKGVELILDLSDVSQSVVYGDPFRLKQIFNNLISNAVKFTNHGEIIVYAVLEPLSSAEGEGEGEGNEPIESLAGGKKACKLRASVEDSGIGISTAHLGSLFEAFTQADTSITRTHGGTGLGLAICNKLCLAMGGAMAVTSEQGRGSCFSFDVNVDRCGDTQAALVPASKSISGLKVLVVDDNQRCAQVIVKQLASWGGEVFSASCALTGLEVCGQHTQAPFDVLMIDYAMPEIDGIEFGMRYRKQFADSNAKLVLMTLLGAEIAPERLSEAGFACAYAKPMTPSDLLHAVGGKD